MFPNEPVGGRLREYKKLIVLLGLGRHKREHIVEADTPSLSFK
jgi:hypothetical protein